MPDEWALSVVPIFKGKGDAMSCGVYRGVKLLEHAMKIVEKVLERRMQRMVKVDKMQFGFMPGKGTIDAGFILRRLQEEYLDKEKKLYMCFVDLEGPEVGMGVGNEEERYTRENIMLKAVTSLYEGA